MISSPELCLSVFWVHVQEEAAVATVHVHTTAAYLNWPITVAEKEKHVDRHVS